MKKFCMILVGLIALFAATDSLAEGTGFGLGVGAHDGDIGFQLRKDFWLGGDISAITGQASVYLLNKTTFMLDADYHFIINPENPSRFYPLVGVQFGFNSDNAKLGLNAGGGWTFMLTQKTAAFLEAKFVITGFDGFTFAGGIYF